MFTMTDSVLDKCVEDLFKEWVCKNLYLREVHGHLDRSHR